MTNGWVHLLRVNMCMPVDEGDCSGILTSCLAHNGPPVIQTVQRSPVLGIPPRGQFCSLWQPPLSQLTPVSSHRMLLQICALLPHYQMLPHASHACSYSVRKQRLYLQKELKLREVKGLSQGHNGPGPELLIQVFCLCPMNFLWVKGNNGYKSPMYSNMHCNNARELRILSHKFHFSWQVRAVDPEHWAEPTELPLTPAKGLP